MSGMSSTGLPISRKYAASMAKSYKETSRNPKHVTVGWLEEFANSNSKPIKKYKSRSRTW